MTTLNDDWAAAIPEFTISTAARTLLRLLTQTDGMTFYSCGEEEAERMGWITRSQAGRCSLTDTGRAVCRQLGIGEGKSC